MSEPTTEAAIAVAKGADLNGLAALVLAGTPPWVKALALVLIAVVLLTLICRPLVVAYVERIRPHRDEAQPKQACDTVPASVAVSIIEELSRQIGAQTHAFEALVQTSDDNAAAIRELRQAIEAMPAQQAVTMGQTMRELLRPCVTCPVDVVDRKLKAG